MKNIGLLEHLISLQSKTETNVGGEATESWTDEGAEYAQVITQKGSEALQSAQSTARQLIRVRIHYRDDIGTGWRVQYDGEDYYVNTVDRSGRRQGELWFTAELVGAR